MTDTSVIVIGSGFGGSVSALRLSEKGYDVTVLEAGRVARAAPILAYMLGWTGRQVADYCRRKGWQWERVA